MGKNVFAAHSQRPIMNQALKGRHLKQNSPHIEEVPPTGQESYKIYILRA